MIRQALAILALKWILLRNTFSAGKAYSWAFTAFLVSLMGIVSLGVSTGLFYLGSHGFHFDNPLMSLGLFDLIILLFFFFWFWGLLIELQRADVIDFRKMLFLPVSLPIVFLLNYIASLFSLALLFFAPCCLGLLLGLSFQFGPRMLLGIPLAMAFFMMLGAWAYYLRGLLAILMENKRRRRLILTVLPLCFIALGQAPSLFTHLLRGGSNEAGAPITEQVFEMAVVYGNLLFPPGWFALGLWSLQEANYPAACAALGGLLLIMALGLRLGFRSTWAYYTGAGKESKSPRIAKPVTKRKRVLTSFSLPLLSGDTAAMTQAAWLSYLRHPNIRTLLIMPLCMGAFLMMMYRSGAYGDYKAGGMWMPVIILVWPFFNFSSVLFNLFGVDRAGFSGLMLLPTPRRRYLLAKNIALFPFVGGIALVFVVLGALLLPVAADKFFISLLQVIQLYLSFCIAGNYISLFFIYRLARDPMRARTNRPLMLLIGLATAAFTGVLLIPSSFCLTIDSIALGYGYAGNWPLGLMSSLILLLCTAFLYGVSLIHAGDLFTLREQRMHATLAKDRE